MKYRMFFALILLASITFAHAMNNNSPRRKSSAEFIKLSSKKRNSGGRKSPGQLSPRDKQKLLESNGYTDQDMFHLQKSRQVQKQGA